MPFVEVWRAHGHAFRCHDQNEFAAVVEVLQQILPFGFAKVLNHIAQNDQVEELRGLLHQVKGADGRAVTVSSPQHFCRSCHDYAAVKVDCFECHASRPEASKASSLDGKGDVAALAGWLEEKAR